MTWLESSISLSLGGLVLLANPGSSQRLFSPDADKLLRRAADAVRSVTAVSYEAGYHLNGEHPEFLPGAEGTVLLQTGGPTGRTRIRIDGSFWYPEREQPRPLSFSTDGHRAYQIQHDTRTHYTSNYNLLKDLLYPGDSLILNAFGSDEPFGYDIDPTNAVYQGELTIGGVDCHVVQIFHNRMGGESVIYLGKNDDLPRRIDRTFKIGDRSLTSSLTLFSLNTNPTLEPGEFHLQAPEGFETENYEGKPKLLEVGTKAPEWKILHANGSTVSLAKLRGKVVVMDFWATWCGPCKRAMPSVQRLHDRFAGEPVVVYGVSTFETTGDPIAYMKKMGYTYQLLVKADPVAEDYHITGIPTFYVIGPKGDIVYTKLGYNEDEEEELVETIEQVLNEYKKTQEY